MIRDYDDLRHECRDFLEDQGYRLAYIAQVEAKWDLLAEWMKDEVLSEFEWDVGIRYCDEVIGTHLIDRPLRNGERFHLRAIRMLMTFQRDGRVEFRTLRKESPHWGSLRVVAEAWQNCLLSVRKLSPRTLENYAFYLTRFAAFMDVGEFTLESVTGSMMTEFMNEQGYNAAQRRNCALALRSLLHTAFQLGFTSEDRSSLVPKISYRRQATLPTTYEKDEIRSTLDAVERASAIGKRDYVILLLAAQYGMRAGDICGLRFQDIDWDENVIRITQSKTDEPAVFPLTASVGNAIIDYAQHGRPECKSAEIIVAHTGCNRGTPLREPTTHSIVTKYMRIAGVKDLDVKKHGTHALRHSLASNMLKDGTPLPLIKTVLGHQSTETTKIYLRIDVNDLRKCPLPMPKMMCIHYLGGEER